MRILKKTNKNGGIKKKILTVNPYENPANVLELMSKICSAMPTADISAFWKTIIEEVYGEDKYSFYNFCNDNKGEFINDDLVDTLHSEINAIANSLTDASETGHTKIVVAGGFSSGKSSFLNRLTGCINLLPSGVEPVSVVKTYLYCSKDCPNVSVRGVNSRGVSVDLNVDVLKSIQHSNKSNVYLASVLDELLVEIPSSYFDGIVFVDTPGYNNSDKINLSNGKTDRKSAEEALKEGDVLFWLVDCERGTTVSDDLEMIKQFQGKKVIIFNKADKKGYKEAQSIVDQAAIDIYNVFSKEEIIDIIAYSSLESQIYYSLNKLNLWDIISLSKNEGGGLTDGQEALKRIGEIFEEEIKYCEDIIVDIQKKYTERSSHRDTMHQRYRKACSDKDNLLEELNNSLIDSYNQLDKFADFFVDEAYGLRNDFIDFFDEVMNFEKNDHWGSSNILTNAIKKASKKIDKHNKTLEEDEPSCSIYNEKTRSRIVKDVEDEEKIIIDRFKESYDKAEEECNNAKKNIEKNRQLADSLKNYKHDILKVIKASIQKYKASRKSVIVTKEEQQINVFEAIRRDDYKMFLRSFENGVDLTECNSDGYNPLNYAVLHGNNTMVTFFLEHDADPSIQDNRGYNAFHTAVENQFKDICAILLDNDPDLIDTKTKNGMEVMTLASKNPFTAWLEERI